MQLGLRGYAILERSGLSLKSQILTRSRLCLAHCLHTAGRRHWALLASLPIGFAGRDALAGGRRLEGVAESFLVRGKIWRFQSGSRAVCGRTKSVGVESNEGGLPIQVGSPEARRPGPSTRPQQSQLQTRPGRLKLQQQVIEEVADGLQALKLPLLHRLPEMPHKRIQLADDLVLHHNLHRHNLQNCKEAAPEGSTVCPKTLKGRTLGWRDSEPFS